LRVASDGVDEICSSSVPKRFRNGEGLLQCPAMAWDERMESRTRSAIGRHRLAGWPTKF
jgi:hypothetical protein